MKTIPTEPFSVTITEEDRQKADGYLSCRNCLIATALKRVGFEYVTADPYTVGLRLNPGDEEVEFSTKAGLEDVCMDGNTYRPEVVGRTFTFTPKKHPTTGHSAVAEVRKGLTTEQAEYYAAKLYYVAIPEEDRFPDHFLSWNILARLLNASPQHQTIALILCLQTPKS